VVVKAGSIRRAKLQHPPSYRSDALPVAQSTVSKHWREIWCTKY